MPDHVVAGWFLLWWLAILFTCLSVSPSKALWLTVALSVVIAGWFCHTSKRWSKVATYACRPLPMHAACNPNNTYLPTLLTPTIDKLSVDSAWLLSWPRNVGREDEEEDS